MGLALLIELFSYKINPQVTHNSHMRHKLTPSNSINPTYLFFIECRNVDGISSPQSGIRNVHLKLEIIQFTRELFCKVQLNKQITRVHRIDINAVALKINIKLEIYVSMRDVCGCFMQLQLNSIINNLPFMTLNFSLLF